MYLMQEPLPETLSGALRAKFAVRYKSVIEECGVFSKNGERLVEFDTSYGDGREEGQHLDFETVQVIVKYQDQPIVAGRVRRGRSSIQLL
jgi:hypothetical protein